MWWVQATLFTLNLLLSQAHISLKTELVFTVESRVMHHIARNLGVCLTLYFWLIEDICKVLKKRCILVKCLGGWRHCVFTSKISDKPQTFCHFCPSNSFYCLIKDHCACVKGVKPIDSANWCCSKCLNMNVLLSKYSSALQNYCLFMNCCFAKNHNKKCLKKKEHVSTCYHIPNKMTDQSVAQLFVSWLSEEEKSALVVLVVQWAGAGILTREYLVLCLWICAPEMNTAEVRETCVGRWNSQPATDV